VEGGKKGRKNLRTPAQDKTGREQTVGNSKKGGATKKAMFVVWGESTSKNTHNTKGPKDVPRKAEKKNGWGKPKDPGGSKGIKKKSCQTKNHINLTTTTKKRGYRRRNANSETSKLNKGGGKQ